LKEKEDPVADDAPAETPSRDPREIVVDVEVAKTADENLTMSEGHDAAKTVVGVTSDGAE
jgi:hypothetical protein